MPKIRADKIKAMMPKIMAAKCWLGRGEECEKGHVNHISQIPNSRISRK